MVRATNGGKSCRNLESLFSPISSPPDSNAWHGIPPQQDGGHHTNVHVHPPLWMCDLPLLIQSTFLVPSNIAISCSCVGHPRPPLEEVGDYHHSWMALKRDLVRQRLGIKCEYTVNTCQQHHPLHIRGEWPCLIERMCALVSIIPFHAVRGSTWVQCNLGALDLIQTEGSTL